MTDDLAQRIANDFKGQKLDGYTIEGLHAKGGTSVVLVGSNGHKQAAIKIYAQELFQKSDAEKERIERQVEKRHLIHPNLVKTYARRALRLSLFDDGVCRSPNIRRGCPRFAA